MTGQLTLWEMTCRHLVAAGAAGWLTKIACADPSPWSITVLGVSLAVLVTSIAGAAARRMRMSEPRKPDAKIPAAVVATVMDGFIAGWVAMALVVVPLSWFGGPDKALGELVLPEVVGALCAVSVVPFLRAKAAGYIDRLFDMFLSWLSRKGAGG